MALQLPHVLGTLWWLGSLDLGTVQLLGMRMCPCSWKKIFANLLLEASCTRSTMRQSLEKVAEAVSTNHRRMADCYQIMVFRAATYHLLKKDEKSSFKHIGAFALAYMMMHEISWNDAWCILHHLALLLWVHICHFQDLSRGSSCAARNITSPLTFENELTCRWSSHRGPHSGNTGVTSFRGCWS